MPDRPLMLVDDDEVFGRLVRTGLRRVAPTAALRQIIDAHDFHAACEELDALEPLMRLIDSRLPDGRGEDLVGDCSEALHARTHSRRRAVGPRPFKPLPALDEERNMLPVEPGLPRLRTKKDRAASVGPMSALRSTAHRLCRLGFAGLAAALTAVALARYHWLAELATHFAVYWALASIGLAAMALVIGARRLALAAVVLAALHAFHLWPYLPGLGAAEARAAAPTSTRLRLLSINVLSGNRNHDAVKALIREERPDVVALIEITDRWMAALVDLQTDYPYRIARPHHDDFGIALWSRRPIRDLKIVPLLNPAFPMIRGRLDVDGTPVHLFAVHTMPPAGASHALMRELQLEQVASQIHDLRSGEVVVMGDLNATPWSPIHRDLEARTKLRNAARGHGILNTWPTAFAPWMIPLDHVLVSKGLAVHSIRTVDTHGSDHLGLLVNLDVPADTTHGSVGEDVPGLAVDGTLDRNADRDGDATGSGVRT